MVTGGSVILNGITNADLIMILQERDKGPGLTFNPGGLVPATFNVPGPTPKSVAGYNNCNLTWNGNDGLKIVYRIIHKMIHGHEHEPNL